MGGAGGNLLGVPWGFKEGVPAWFAPREQPTTYVSRWNCSRSAARHSFAGGQARSHAPVYAMAATRVMGAAAARTAAVMA
jgi:hypothetical protein